jgi:hypothetical protein
VIDLQLANTPDADRLASLINQETAAHRDRLLDVLEAVMGTLVKATGSPEETKAWHAGWSELAEAGRGVKWAEWIDRTEEQIEAMRGGEP